MAYRISGLEPEAFAKWIGASSKQLTDRGALRVTADARPGFPCRITLEDAEVGETLILLNHVSHDVATPFRAAHAIYIRERAVASAMYEDKVPPVFATRTLSLRGFDASGMLIDAMLALSGAAKAGIVALFANPQVAYIHAHNAAPGCFAARVDRA